MYRTLATASVVVMLSACGGGGSDEPEAPPAPAPELESPHVYCRFNTRAEMEAYFPRWSADLAAGRVDCCTLEVVR